MTSCLRQEETNLEEEEETNLEEEETILEEEEETNREEEEEINLTSIILNCLLFIPTQSLLSIF